MVEMSNIHNYPSVICEYCPYTDYGDKDVGTNQFNMCEGIKCEEAFNNYKNENPDDERILDEMF